MGLDISYTLCVYGNKEQLKQFREVFEKKETLKAIKTSYAGLLYSDDEKAVYDLLDAKDTHTGEWLVKNSTNYPDLQFYAKAIYNFETAEEHLYQNGNNLKYADIKFDRDNPDNTKWSNYYDLSFITEEHYKNEINLMPVTQEDIDNFNKQLEQIPDESEQARTELDELIAEAMKDDEVK